MIRSRTFTVVIVIAVGASFFGGGLVHALVPHSHGGEVMAQTMHAALRHEDKKSALAILPTSFVLILAAILLCVPVPNLTREFVPRGKRDKLLWRGIEKYRRFG